MQQQQQQEGEDEELSLPAISSRLPLVWPAKPAAIFQPCLEKGDWERASSWLVSTSVSSPASSSSSVPQSPTGSTNITTHATVSSPTSAILASPDSDGGGSSLYCSTCRKKFGNSKTLQTHMGSQKHKKAVAALAAGSRTSRNVINSGGGKPKKKGNVTALSSSLSQPSVVVAANASSSLSLAADDAHLQRAVSDAEARHDMPKLYQLLWTLAQVRCDANLCAGCAEALYRLWTHIATGRRHSGRRYSCTTTTSTTTTTGATEWKMAQEAALALARLHRRFDTDAALAWYDVALGAGAPPRSSTKNYYSNNNINNNNSQLREIEAGKPANRPSAATPTVITPLFTVSHSLRCGNLGAAFACARIVVAAWHDKGGNERRDETALLRVVLKEVLAYVPDSFGRAAARALQSACVAHGPVRAAALQLMAEELPSGHWAVPQLLLCAARMPLVPPLTPSTLPLSSSSIGGGGGGQDFLAGDGVVEAAAAAAAAVTPPCSKVTRRLVNGFSMVLSNDDEVLCARYDEITRALMSLTLRLPPPQLSEAAAEATTTTPTTTMTSTICTLCQAMHPISTPELKFLQAVWRARRMGGYSGLAALKVLRPQAARLTASPTCPEILLNARGLIQDIERFLCLS